MDDDKGELKRNLRNAQGQKKKSKNKSIHIHNTPTQ